MEFAGISRVSGGLPRRAVGVGKNTLDHLPLNFKRRCVDIFAGLGALYSEAESNL